MEDVTTRRRAGGSSFRVSLSGTNLERAGDYNQRVILQAIRVHGPVTRVELAGLTGLATPTIANITNRLIAENLVIMAGRRHGARGQPAFRLEVDPDGCFALGVNIDRNHITVVLMDLLGQVRAKATTEVRYALPDQVRTFLAKAITEMLAANPAARERLLGVGVAIPDDLGAVHLSHQPDEYAVWRDTDIPELIRSFLSVDVYVENDATAAAIGELQFGYGLECPTFFYILLSEGLGGGLVVDGAYMRGATGRSGEIGFMTLTDRSGRTRTLQDLVSLAALFDHLADAGVEVASCDDLTGLDQKGRDAVDEWLEQAADYLMGPLQAVNCIVNPMEIFIGGRLPVAHLDALIEKISRRLDEQRGALPNMAPVRRAAMAVDAPAIGAAILPLMERVLPSDESLSTLARAS